MKDGSSEGKAGRQAGCACPLHQNRNTTKRNETGKGTNKTGTESERVSEKEKENERKKERKGAGQGRAGRQGGESRR